MTKRRSSYTAPTVHFDGQMPMVMSGEPFPVNAGHGGEFELRGELTGAETRLPLGRLIAMTLASIFRGQDHSK